jgi:hypothetical protein
VINPAWAVAGVLLILTGSVYALIGIRTKWLHTFFSTAFLASLGTTVLIIYVMTTPVSEAVQGAYVVAIVLTGAILGGLAMVFRDVTEGLGCIFGGFSLSMWLLTQSDGGIIASSVGRIIFIAGFCAVTFSLYFSRFTRTYALIGSIAFGGASAAVLGIDYFSRAGLKEFWVYLWAVNSNVFPLGADTYPLTRGIRVELAATFLLFLAGIVSQMRLWTVIKDRRAKRDEAKKETDRQLEIEEENVGRQVEAAIARDREEWEAARGDGTHGRVGGSTDSGVGDMESEKRLRHSTGTATTKEVASVAEEPIELSEIPLPDARQAPTVTVTRALIKQDGTGVVTTRVGEDERPKDEANIAHTGKPLPDDSCSQLPAAQTARSSAIPVIVPLPFRVLPFRVPEHDVDADHDNRSSIAATFADEDLERGGSRRSSFAKRLSVGSAKLLRSLSQRSRGTNVEATNSPKFRESHEDLVRAEEGLRDDSSSMAPALDELEDDEDEKSVYDDEKAGRIEVSAELGNKTPNAANLLQPAPMDARPTSMAETVATSILDGTGVSEGPAESARVAEQADQREIDVVGSPKETKEKSRGGTSVVSSTNSARGSLTRGNLPRALSRVAMSYRTNEWAKHLSNAENPEPDTLQVPEDMSEEQSSTHIDEETVAPLDAALLQQTAETGAPPIAAPRLETAMSNYRQSQALERSESKSTVPGEALRSATTTPTNPYRAMSSALARRVSGLPEAIAEEADERPEASSEDVEAGEVSRTATPPKPESRPPVPGVVSYSSPQTLIGQRDMLLRNKSHTAFYVPPNQDQDSLGQLPSQRGANMSMVNLPAYAALSGQPSMPNAGQTALDADNLSLNQRRELIRQSSLTTADLRQDGIGLHPLAMSSAPAINASSTAFNSHQPQRVSKLPSAAQRESALANFRSSVAADLRAGSPALGVKNGASMSMASLPGVYGVGAPAMARRSAIDVQREMMLAQRDAEVQHKEAERLEKERMDQVFGERTRMSGMLEAHREKMRRMQSVVRDS